jgi:hypothetical protein
MPKKRRWKLKELPSSRLMQMLPKEMIPQT